jgi:carbamoyl-phosphate synthase small subunit
MKMYLILENGMIFEGEGFGAQNDVTGEVVFTTGMTGYLETLTDPSYYGQIVLQTFPLIGNYGVIPPDFESENVGPKAYIVKHLCQNPSNFRSEGNLDSFLRRHTVTGLSGIDTRAVTKVIRERGVMNGKITSQKPSEDDLSEIQAHKIKAPVLNVTSREKKLYKAEAPKFTVALYNFGAKENIRRELQLRGCDVWVFPASSTADEILSVSPHGIMLSNGPGDPTDNPAAIENIKTLMQKNIPMFGICLGHQLMALANGCFTRKLKYGHRGANQPVKDTQTGKVYISSQNHGYEVISESIRHGTANEWFYNVNDKSCEGIIYKNAPAFSVQFHPEACGGPRDTAFIFDKFISMMGGRDRAVE